MAKTYAAFKSTVLGKGYDVDGYYGCQCWDGYAYYCQWLGIGYANCTSTGYVQDIWNNRKTNGVLNYFTEVNVMQAGDVAVFRKVAGITPYSHIAIFDSDAGGGYGWFLGQNQGGANGVFNLVKLPYSATFDTALRPKCLQTATTIAGTEKWDQNATIKKGDTVKSISCAITGISGNCVNVPALGGLVPLAHVTEASDTGDGRVDNVLSTTNARVYLDPTTVTAINAKNNTVQVSAGYWVNAGPLMVKK